MDLMDQWIESKNPATGEIVGKVKKASREEMGQMLLLSKIAQEKWRKLPIHQRITLIDKACKEIGGQAKEMAVLLSKEMGKSLDRASGEVRGCTYGAYTAKLVSKAIEPVVMEGNGMETVIEYNPLGICAIITPWNYPLSMAHWMIIPALTAGNSVILKPSEETPLIAQAYVDAMNRVLPEHVLQILHGDEEQGKLLVEAPEVAFVGFTGSREAGKDIMRRASGTLKRLIMELGGKDPLIVLEDANLSAAANFAVANSLENSGQMCVSTERVFVDSKIAKPFIKKVIETVSYFKAGPYDNPSAQVGPIINNRQRSRILNQIEEAVRNGAQIVYGGENHPEGYVLPTVLTNVSKDMEISREETFGPVICISEFNNPEDAIREANSTEFGLGAVIFGRENVDSLANQLEAGMVGINMGVGGMGDSPWVGTKQSGLGYHGSPDGHRQFTQVRVINRPSHL